MNLMAYNRRTEKAVGQGRRWRNIHHICRPIFDPWINLHFALFQEGFKEDYCDSNTPQEI
jgi:hypothetical protein